MLLQRVIMLLIRFYMWFNDLNNLRIKVRRCGDEINHRVVTASLFQGAREEWMTVEEVADLMNEAPWDGQ